MYQVHNIILCRMLRRQFFGFWMEGSREGVWGNPALRVPSAGAQRRHVIRGLGTRPQAGCGAAALRLLVQRRRLRFRRSGSALQVSPTSPTCSKGLSALQVQPYKSSPTSPALQVRLAQKACQPYKSDLLKRLVINVIQRRRLR